MSRLNDYAARIEDRLKELFAEHGIPSLLAESMRYSLLAGGKRLRPSMMLACADMFGGDTADVLEYACAVEMIHTYSLIHDDLPGMDDDTMRRGRPTNHVVYGVGQAILAGDGLLNSAFEHMLDHSVRRGDRPSTRLRAVREIALGSGIRGMVAGQVADLESEKNGAQDEKTLRFIQLNKTARMFMHPLRAAAMLSGASENDTDAMGDYGRFFGLLFQATDDLLDVTGDASAVGKTLGKDSASGKLTCISCYGLDGTRTLVGTYAEEARRTLSGIDADTAFFLDLVTDMVTRTK